VTQAWAGDGVRKARAHVATTLPRPCGKCGQTVEPDPPGTPPGQSGWVVGHVVPRGAHPELTWQVSNWQAEHRRCSDASGQAGVQAKARADALRGAVIPQPGGPAQTHVLADIAAKRRIVERYERAYDNALEHPDDLAAAGALLALHGAIADLLMAHADRDDFPEEWR